MSVSKKISNLLDKLPLWAESTLWTFAGVLFFAAIVISASLEPTVFITLWAMFLLVACAFLYVLYTIGKSIALGRREDKERAKEYNELVGRLYHD